MGLRREGGCSIAPTDLALRALPVLGALARTHAVRDAEQRENDFPKPKRARIRLSLVADRRSLPIEKGKLTEYFIMFIVFQPTYSRWLLAR